MAKAPRPARKPALRPPARTRRGPLARRRRLSRAARLTGGWLILAVGVAFVILPVLPGLPVVVLAAFLLAPDVPLFAGMLDSTTSRFSPIGMRAATTPRFVEDFRRRFHP